MIYMLVRPGQETGFIAVEAESATIARMRFVDDGKLSPKDEACQVVQVPEEGWVHCTDPEKFGPGSGHPVFGWIQGGRLWSGIVTKADPRHLRVYVKNVRPGSIDRNPSLINARGR